MRITSNRDISFEDDGERIVVDASANDINVTWDTADDLGDGHTIDIMRDDDSGHVVTLCATSNDTFGGIGPTFDVVWVGNNGSGAIRVGVPEQRSIVTGSRVYVTGIPGVSGATGFWNATQIQESGGTDRSDLHVDLVGSTWPGGGASTSPGGKISVARHKVCLHRRGSQAKIISDGASNFDVWDATPDVVAERDFLIGSNRDYKGFHTDGKQMHRVGFAYLAKWLRGWCRTLVIGETGDPPESGLVGIAAESPGYPEGAPHQTISGQNLGIRGWAGIDRTGSVISWQGYSIQMVGTALENFVDGKCGAKLVISMMPVGGGALTKVAELMPDGSVWFKGTVTASGFIEE